MMMGVVSHRSEELIMFEASFMYTADQPEEVECQQLSMLYLLLFAIHMNVLIKGFNTGK